MGESAVPHAYGYLTQPEIRFLDAAVDRLIPVDELGPGAAEAGVTIYIDRQLCSVWGTHGRNYRSGPWLDGTPQQGFQSRFTPQEIYRAGIRESNQYCNTQYGKNFEFLAAAPQEEVLQALEHGKVELPSLSSKLFFDLLWRPAEEMHVDGELVVADLGIVQAEQAGGAHVVAALFLLAGEVRVDH